MRKWLHRLSLVVLIGVMFVVIAAHRGREHFAMAALGAGFVSLIIAQAFEEHQTFYVMAFRLFGFAMFALSILESVGGGLLLPE